ncbi:YchF family ATPase [bacterium]|nr:YchF family ATPase [bacterium]
MQVGLIGLPQSGKTTIFNALTRLNFDVSGYTQEKIESHVGSVKIPDSRIDHLVSVYSPKKTTFAEIVFTDIGCKKRDDGHSQFDLDSMRKVDMLALVVCAFKSDSVVHPLGGINPLRDVGYLCSELILSDLALVETRLERLEKEMLKPKKPDPKEINSLKRFKEHLENEQFLCTLEIDEETDRLFRGYQFLTLKPMMVIINTGESTDESVSVAQTETALKSEGKQFLSLSGKLEMEISQLNDEDKTLFLEELGIEKPALNRFILTAFALLNRIVFFTVGEDEVRAWEVENHIHAKSAAGKIHSDIERGFIRAEVLGYADFIACANSFATAKSRGLVRLEGKEYCLNDGDIISFRFNV